MRHSYSKRKTVMKTEENVPLFTDRTYKLVRRLVEYVMPAFGTLYFTLSQIWGLPYGEEVVGTVAAFTLFLAAVVGLGRRSYEASDEARSKEMVIEALHNAPPGTEAITFNVRNPHTDDY